MTNAINPFYTWKQDGEIVSTDTVYVFNATTLGTFFVNFNVDADNGSVEKQARVSVVDRLPPEITISSSLVAYVNEETELAATANYTDETTTFEWSYNGSVVSTDSIYTFVGDEINVYTVALKVTNADGEAVQNIEVTVIERDEPTLFFDNGRYVEPSTIHDIRTMTCPIGRSLVLAPVRISISDEATYTWEVDGEMQSETSLFFTFTPGMSGRTYAVTVTANDNGNTASATINVECTPPEGTYFREITDESSYISNYCYEYIPAPGQFIDFSEDETIEDARLTIQDQLDAGNGESSYLASLGAWGGYLILAFDHSVEDDGDGEADIYMGGNAFAGWSECGVVWVSQDDNGDGIPNDTWYELKGSEYGKEGVTQRYAMKYYRPSDSRQDILCIDNEGNLTFIERNSYHPDSGYYPFFLKEEYYILTGTCLGNHFTIEGGLEGNAGFDWGYVDDINDSLGLCIENAIQQDGTPANLKYIDFIKVHTAQLGQGTLVGEVSTESRAAIDIRLRDR